MRVKSLSFAVLMVLAILIGIALTFPAQAAYAPPCDEETFEGQTTCRSENTLTFVPAPQPPIPEPGTFAMLAAGVGAVALLKLRRRQDR